MAAIQNEIHDYPIINIIITIYTLYDIINFK